ncbi:hypothetical protein [Sneathiella litorea]|uniref:Glycosyltransferase RgtA/B/C/D-like domain-containing protein n=1 Tax=Sneathiella litorea TaxID=2606216 RepID=A0A6L8WBB8_9PROT|nr:hypothetical protein [Sneathiella litorea]MZR31723.1 hypothetical protein [Sneathiella litorea]
MTRFANVGSAAIFLFLSVLLVISRITVVIAVHPVVFLALSIAIIVLIFRLTQGYRASLWALAAIVGFCAIIAAWAISTQFLYDAGHDGHSYHLTAIWDIADGWSPFLSPHDNIWVDSYPSGYWVLQSYLVSTTGLLLSGKSLTIGLMVAVALLAYGFFLDHCSDLVAHYRNFWAFLFAVFVVANPVTVTQIMTHYIDGSLYLLGSAFALFLLSDTFSANRFAKWSAVGCIILMVNTKTASLYYVPMIVFASLMAGWALKKIELSHFQFLINWILSRGILLGMAFIVGITVIGYKPYVTNILDHGELLYPSVDKIMATNIPENLEPLPVPMKFLYGILSRTEDSVWPVLVTAPVHLKIPGTFQLSEFKDLDFDTRRGGFGPFFSLALILSFAVYLLSKLTQQHDSNGPLKRKGDAMALFAIILFGASVLFPESWWARYVPFTWLVVLLLTLSSLFHAKRGSSPIASQILVAVIVLCFAGNIVAGLLGSLRQSWQTYQRTAVIEKMKNYPIIELTLIHDPRVIKDDQSTAITYSDHTWTTLLRERGIKTRITSEFRKEDCEISGFFDGNILWCAKNKPRDN